MAGGATPQQPFNMSRLESTTKMLSRYPCELLLIIIRDY